MPGEGGEDVDWLNVLERKGLAAVRDGVLAAKLFKLSDVPQGEQQESFLEGVARLAKLPPLEYDRQRKPFASKWGCRVTTLDGLVNAARGDVTCAPGQGQPINLLELEPWNTPVAGATLLDGLSSTISTYVILSIEQADATALWSLHAHAHDASDVSPHLSIKSAQKRSGKTRLVKVMARLVPRPLFTSGITASALLRIVEIKAPTLLLDELDAAMKKDREMAQALRGIMNSAFERAGACFILNVPVPGGGYEPRQFSTWAPLLLAGIGDLPDTVRDRSIEIEMVRKRRDEIVRRLRRRDGDDLNILGRKAARWVSDNVENIKVATPTIPAGLNDRAADAWEPLLAIADAAGGEWPQRARRAALALSGEQAIEDDNIGTQLLSDIRAVFTEDRMKSETLVGLLNGLEDRPWAEFGRTSKGLTPNMLARLLKQYKIRPAGTIRMDSGESPLPRGTSCRSSLMFLSDTSATSRTKPSHRHTPTKTRTSRILKPSHQDRM
jgi:putative DNA primase/helicase